MSQAGSYNRGSGAAPVETLTGNSGGAVPPTGGNINIVGTGVVDVTGNPGTSTLTISVDQTVAETFTTDSGVATPVANNIDIIGGTGITTSAVGDTIIITSSASSGIIQLEADDGDTASGASVNVLGGDNITTSGDNVSTITVAVSGTTNHSVQVGNASGSLASLAVGTNGQVLTGVTGSDPIFAAPAASSISITGDTGGALVGAAFTFSGGTTGLSFGGAVATETLTFAGITANGGTVNLGTDNAANAITIGTGNVARLINIGQSAAAHVINIGVNNGASSLGLNAGTGDMRLISGDEITLDASGVLELNSTGAAISIGNDANAFGINVGTGAAARTITIGNNTTTTALQLTSGTGSITLTSTGTGDIVLDSDDTMLLDADGVLELNSSGGVISIGNDSDNNNINIGTAGTRTINLGSAAASIDIGGFAEGALVTSSAGVVSTVTGTTGYVLTANAAGTAPSFQVAGGGGMTWTEVTGTSQSMAVNNGYILNNGGLVTATLPATAAVGDIVAVVGKGAGGWAIAQNAGDTIHFGNVNTTTGAGGSLASTNRYDSIELICVTANDDWVVRNSIGNITYV